MGGYNQFLYYYTISRVSRIKLLARPRQPFFLDAIRRYSKENYDHHAEEKAPTTAEEFTRVAEEMAEEKEHQGFSSQTVDKAQETTGKENSHKKCDDSDDLLKSNPQNQISS
ncbi:uncharacterized protein LOC125808925 [Solanum verrucosum]|uniref:uncharacterized protein LOC125808925 n=1 Tax=Solanum verrucosum TaxID=315347 RepID=UPI0020D05EED|nr:uncharacterized protein LOC125808925 [Solanum verrucosum]